jgi:hypothetical protein
MNFSFKDKGHKSLEYCCLVIHLTSISTISYAESNGGIFILIAPLGNTSTTVQGQTYCEWFVNNTYCERFVNNTIRLIFKGHKSLEYCCLVIHLTSVSTISYAESNGGIFVLIAPLGITNTISYFTLQFSRFHSQLLGTVVG